MASFHLAALGLLGSGREAIWLPIPLLVLALLTKPIADGYLWFRDRMAYRALMRDARRALRRSAREAARADRRAKARKGHDRSE